MKIGGIVLCGGKSSRMGRPKAWLPFAGEFMLQRAVRVLREVVDPVVVVAARDQDVPPLPAEVVLVRDEIDENGPLAGLAAGLTALAGKCDAVYLSACDAPFLKPEFVRRVVAFLGDQRQPTPPSPLPKGKGEQTHEVTEIGPTILAGAGAFSPFPVRRGLQGEPPPGSPSQGTRGDGGVGSAVPRVGGFLHPLAAAYRVGVLPAVCAMLAEGRLRATDLFDRVPTRVIEPEELIDVDPELVSLRNLNSPGDYETALRLLLTGSEERP